VNVIVEFALRLVIQLYYAREKGLRFELNELLYSRFKIKSLVANYLLILDPQFAFKHVFTKF